jgi:hypothetical protein
MTIATELRVSRKGPKEGKEKEKNGKSRLTSAVSAKPLEYGICVAHAFCSFHFAEDSHVTTNTGEIISKAMDAPVVLGAWCLPATR